VVEYRWESVPGEAKPTLRVELTKGEWNGNGDFGTARRAAGGVACCALRGGRCDPLGRRVLLVQPRRTLDGVAGRVFRSKLCGVS
jgi:hypothetical protein